MPRGIEYYKAKAEKQLVQQPRNERRLQDEVVKEINDENEPPRDSDGMSKPESLVAGEDKLEREGKSDPSNRSHVKEPEMQDDRERSDFKGVAAALAEAEAATTGAAGSGASGGPAPVPVPEPAPAPTDEDNKGEVPVVDDTEESADKLLPKEEPPPAIVSEEAQQHHVTEKEEADTPPVEPKAPAEFIIDTVDPPHVVLLSYQGDDDGNGEENDGTTTTIEPKCCNPLAALPHSTTVTKPFKVERILYLTLTTKTSGAFIETSALHAFLNKTIPCIIVSASSSSFRTTVKVETNKRGEFGVRHILGKKWVGGGAVWTIGGGKSKRIKGGWRGGGGNLTKSRRKEERGGEEGEEGDDDQQRATVGDKGVPSKKATTSERGFVDALDEVSELRKREFRRIGIIDVLDELDDTYDLSRVMKVWLSGGVEEYDEVFEEESKEESKWGEKKEEMKEESKEEGKREYGYDSDDSSISSVESLTNLIIARATLQTHIYKQSEASEVEGKFTIFNIARSVSKILSSNISIIDVSEVMRIIGHSIRNSVASSTYSDYEDLHKPLVSMRWRWLLGKRLAAEQEIHGLGYDIFLKILWIFDRVKREELVVDRGGMGRIHGHFPTPPPPFGLA